MWACPSLQLLLQIHDKVVGVILMDLQNPIIICQAMTEEIEYKDNVKTGNQVSFPSGGENLWGISGPYKAHGTESI